MSVFVPVIGWYVAASILHHRGHREMAGWVWLGAFFVMVAAGWTVYIGEIR